MDSCKSWLSWVVQVEVVQVISYNTSEKSKDCYKKCEKRRFQNKEKIRWTSTRTETPFFLFLLHRWSLVWFVIVSCNQILIYSIPSLSAYTLRNRACCPFYLSSVLHCKPQVPVGKKERKGKEYEVRKTCFQLIPPRCLLYVRGTDRVVYMLHLHLHLANYQQLDS